MVQSLSSVGIAKSNSITPVYELKMPCFSKDLYRKSGDADWQPVKDLLYKTSQNPFFNVRGFVASTGKNTVGKSGDASFRCSQRQERNRAMKPLLFATTEPANEEP